MWNMHCGIQNVEYGMWNAECRMQNAECGIRNVECGMQNAQKLQHIMPIKGEGVFFVKTIEKMSHCSPGVWGPQLPGRQTKGTLGE